MRDAIQTAVWLDAFVEATEEVAGGFLGLDSSLTAKMLGTCDPDSGAYISIVGKQSSRHIGLVCDARGCRKLAEAMLCTEEGEELDEEDIVDAVGEVINIIAGGIKQRLLGLDPSLKLGIPLFVDGRARTATRCESGEAALCLGDVDAKLVILGVSK